MLIASRVCVILPETHCQVAMYWAIITISTMGYGDVLPVNTAERVFSVGVALIGAVVFSFSMGNITSLISQTAGADARFDEKMRVIQEWMEFRCVRVLVCVDACVVQGLCLRLFLPLCFFLCACLNEDVCA